jgi:hypothetical protein
MREIDGAVQVLLPCLLAPVYDASLGFAFDRSRQSLVESGFSLGILLIRNLASLVFHLKLKEFFF